MIRTVIRKPFVQAGVKSEHYISVNPNTGKVDSLYRTGKTKLLGIPLPSRSDDFYANSIVTDEHILVLYGGSTGSLTVPADIDYAGSILINRNSGNTLISGFSDGFPSYEFYLNDNKISDFQQGSFTQLGGYADNREFNHFTNAF